MFSLQCLDKNIFGILFGLLSTIIGNNEIRDKRGKRHEIMALSTKRQDFIERGFASSDRPI